MRDIIRATLGSDHFLKCQTYTIARNGEGLTPCLFVSIPENLAKYWAYIDFKKPNGETFKTPRIDVVEEILEYNIPGAVLDADGKLYLQIIFQNESNEIWKSYVKEFAVRESINATDDIPNKQDFITEAQKTLDEANEILQEIKESGTGGGGIVDQDYDPTSENAQSGKAVTQAVDHARPIVDQTFDDTSNNAQSGTAIGEFLWHNYYTKEETNAIVGDIETALDSIIEIQNTLIGGESV